MCAIGFGAEIAVGRGGVRAASGFDFSGGVLPAGASLTRASTGWYHGAGGVLASAAANAPRFDRDPSSGAFRGLLVEPAATNRIADSRQFDAASWTTQNASIAANAGTAPDGTATADKLIDTTASARHMVLSAVPVTSGTIYCFSAFARAAERTRIELYCSNGGTAVACGFDLATLSPFAATIAGTVAPGAAAIIDAGAGWRRISVDLVAAGATMDARLYLNNGTSIAYPGDGASGLLLWGAQIEDGTRPTSAIPTSGAATSRAADVLTLDWASRGVPDGAVTLRYTFDDASVQDRAATVAGGTMTVPTDLDRARIRAISLA